jgi:2'-5' RNA ligase
VRLFVAVWPSEQLEAALVRLDRPARRGVRWTAPSQWHVTLRFLGSVDDVDSVTAALSQLGDAGTLTAVTAVAGPAVERLGRAILCLPVGGLEGLFGAVVAATRSIGEPPPDRPFRGHLTLARAKEGVDLRLLAGTPVAGTWPVSELTLVASTLDPAGARYEILARLPVP